MSEDVEIYSKWKMNTAMLMVIVLLSALGVILRYFVRITIIPGVVELTPSFLIPLLAGLLAGIPGGVLSGFLVGISGMAAGGEIPVLPLLGNIALGLGTAIGVLVAGKMPKIARIIIYTILGGLIGGFIPTFLITYFLDTPVIAVCAAAGFIDFAQAALWAFVGTILKWTIIDPNFKQYIYNE